MKLTYEVRERPANLGGGWDLALFEDGERAGGGVFPAPEADAEVVMAWWAAVPEAGREHWVKAADSDIPAHAYHAHMLVEAYADAVNEGDVWVGSAN